MEFKALHHHSSEPIPPKTIARFKPSLYLVKEGVELPYLLSAAGQAFPDVKVLRYVNLPALLRSLSHHGPGIFRDLSRGSDLVRGLKTGT